MRQDKEPEPFADPFGSANALDAVLERRLRTHIAAPLAVAFSGGGDSLALLLAAKAWADANGRRLLALTVDHGLNPASTDWTRWCGETAERLGVAFQALRWEGAKPAAGLPAMPWPATIVFSTDSLAISRSASSVMPFCFEIRRQHSMAWSNCP